MALVVQFEGVTVPVRLEALDDPGDVMATRRHHRVVTRLGQIPRDPVERLDERRLIVHHHRFLVGEIERRIGVLHVDVHMFERLAGGVIVVLTAAPGRIEHHADLDPASLRRDDGLEQPWIGEDEHLDAERPRGAFDSRQDRLGGIVRQHNQRTGHASSPPVKWIGGDEVESLDATNRVRYKPA